MKIVIRNFFLLFVALQLCLKVGITESVVWAQSQAASPNSVSENALNKNLEELLSAAGFTGRMHSSLSQRLGRRLNQSRVRLGKNLFFDPILGLRGDNSCAGCHSPRHGFGDSQSIAIGIMNNGKVGPNRSGPRNQRRTPGLLNIAFYPKLMLNGRFFAPSGDPFDNSQGFTFPLPEGLNKFPANHPRIKHLLVAQAHIPSTELVESTGFRGTAGVLDPKFQIFDDGKGLNIPAPDSNGFRNDAIRDEVLVHLNKNNVYRRLFEKAFPQQGIQSGNSVDFIHVAQALAEFQFSLTRANAPIDQFAKGDKSAMSASQKRGAVVFFGKASCVNCHSVAGKSFEMFSDFENHNIGVPQLVPVFGKTTGNVVFDGSNSDQDFGAEQVSADSADRYKFRTSPLRNVSLQPTFFHDGAFTRLEDAVGHHLDVIASAKNYDPKRAGVKEDLRRINPIIDPILENLDPMIQNRVSLSNQEFLDLIQFLKIGLLGKNTNPKNLCKLIPERLPSRRKLPKFEGC